MPLHEKAAAIYERRQDEYLAGVPALVDMFGTEGALASWRNPSQYWQADEFLQGVNDLTREYAPDSPHYGTPDGVIVADRGDELDPTAPSPLVLNFKRMVVPSEIWIASQVVATSGEHTYLTDSVEYHNVTTSKKDARLMIIREERDFKRRDLVVARASRLASFPEAKRLVGALHEAIDYKRLYG